MSQAHSNGFQLCLKLYLVEAEKYFIFKDLNPPKKLEEVAIITLFRVNSSMFWKSYVNTALWSFTAITRLAQVLTIFPSFNCQISF